VTSRVCRNPPYVGATAMPICHIAMPPIEDYRDGSDARLIERIGHDPSALEVYENDRYRWLQNANGTLQSLMDRRCPERLVLPYTAAMMVALVFIDAPRSTLMLGLGGASQARFLTHHFTDLRITAWESDGRVIAMAGRHFALPGEDRGVRVVSEDARTGIAAHGHCANLILLDLFSADGLVSWVCEQELHENCRRALDAHGVLCANLWVDADDECFAVMDGIQEAFQRRTLVLAVPGYRNFVVLAFKGASRLDFASLEARARDLSERTGIDFLMMLDRMRESNVSDEVGFAF
jgi:spermidine synthase